MLKINLRFYVCLLIACFFITTGNVYAESRFESGFRGISWGAHKDNLPVDDLGLTKKALKNIYKTGPSSVFFMEGKGNLEMNLDGVPLLSIFLHFQDQVFTGVDLIFDPANREKIYNILKKDTDAVGSAVEDGYRWKTESMEILLTDRELMIVHTGIK